MHKFTFEVSHCWCRCNMSKSCHVLVLECLRKLGLQYSCYCQCCSYLKKTHWGNVCKMMGSKLQWFCSSILGLIPKEHVARPKGLCSKVCKVCWVRPEHACCNCALVLGTWFLWQLLHLTMLLKKCIWVVELGINMFRCTLWCRLPKKTKWGIMEWLGTLFLKRSDEDFQEAVVIDIRYL